MNWLVGTIVALGSFFLVLGAALLGSMQTAMDRSVVESIAGDLQVYSSHSKDDYVGFSLAGPPDLAPIDDFAHVRQALLQVPNVKDVVPMDFGGGLLVGGNTLDQLLARLRELEREASAGQPHPDEVVQVTSHIRAVGQLLLDEEEQNKDLLDPRIVQEDERYLKQALAPAFWDAFPSHPFESLEFLENRIAPLVNDDLTVAFSALATDLPDYQRNFSRLEIVQGQMIPPGAAGILFPQAFYDDKFELRAARGLAKLKDARAKGKKIAEDEELKRLVASNRSHKREILLQLTPEKAAQALTRLRTALHAPQAKLPDLLDTLFNTDDANFDAREHLFQTELAPLLKLHRVMPGDDVVVKGETKTGSVRSVKLHVYGTFRFRGLDSAPLLSDMSVMDLGTYQRLAGYPTAEDLAAAAQLEKQAGVQPLSASEAEAMLQQSGPAEVSLDGAAPFQLAPATGAQVKTSSAAVEEAAVIYADRDQAARTFAAVKATIAREKLPLHVAQGKDFIGFLESFLVIVRSFLYVVAVVVFLVMAIMINTATTLAMIRRTGEMGTLRAIGASRKVVFGLVLAEGTLVALGAALVGASAGVAVTLYLGHHGLAAPADWMTLFFGGDHLFPVLSLAGVAVGIATVVLVVTLAVLSPARWATRVEPIRAMQREE